MIPKETIDEIFETALIDEVVGEFVTLKKRGVNLIGVCPFHNEKTPSFTVSPVKGIYKCFGCGAGGNSVNFIMEHEHYTYPEALRYLAKKYGIEIEEEELTPEMEQELSERESQYIVSAFAEKYFIEHLHNSEEGQAIGLSYFKERGFTVETIEKFKLGYSPNKNDAFTQTALKEGYKLEYLQKTGLTKGSEDNLYDGYRGRVMFPIHNLSGRVIAFGGRTLKTDKKVAKYVNTPECDIYHKSKVLYGIYFAKKSIIQGDNCYLVEGYTDVISLHQSGVENVVASSGTSLTQDQIKLVKRYTNNITILYDGDTAGIKASFRGIDMILEEGMNVRVVLFPDGEDPDSYARELSEEELKNYITDNAKDFIVFKSDLLSKEAEGDPIKKSALIHEIVESIALVPDHITRSLYTKQCAKLLDVAESALISEINKSIRKKLSKKRNQPVQPEIPPIEQYEDLIGEVEETDIGNQFEHQERDIIRLLLNYMGESFEYETDEKEKIEVTVDQFLLHEIISDELQFKNAHYQSIIEAFVNAFEKEETLTQNYFINHQNPVIQKIAVDLISDKHSLADWESRNIIVQEEKAKLKRAALEGSYSYKIKRIEGMIIEEEEKIKSFDASSYDNSLVDSLNKLKQLKDLKRQIAVKIGRPI